MGTIDTFPLTPDHICLKNLSCQLVLYSIMLISICQTLSPCTGQWASTNLTLLQHLVTADFHRDSRTANLLSLVNEAYAIQIARDWNAERNDPPVGYVTRFKVRMSYLGKYPIHVAGGSQHTEH